MFQHCRLWHPPRMIYSSPAVPGGRQANILLSKTSAQRGNSLHPTQVHVFNAEQQNQGGTTREHRLALSPPTKTVSARCISSNQIWSFLHPASKYCMACFLVLQIMDHIVRLDGVFWVLNFFNLLAVYMMYVYLAKAP